jgi:hypothetical protein
VTRNAMHSTEDVVTVFARQGIAISTIARAMAIPVDRVHGMCRRAIEASELQMMPPATPDDPRHALLSELTNLRAQLDDAQQEVRSFTDAKEVGIDTYTGIAKMTRKEAAVVAAIARYGRATKPAIYHALYGGLGDDDQREPKIVDVFVCKVRKKLLPFGISIGTIWGTGYSMAPADVEALQELARVQQFDSFAVQRKVGMEEARAA